MITIIKRSDIQPYRLDAINLFYSQCNLSMLSALKIMNKVLTEGEIVDITEFVYLSDDNLSLFIQNMYAVGFIIQIQKNKHD